MADAFLQKKASLVRLRYDIFRKVIADRGITWNENTNRMSGNNDEWRRIFRATPFARVYCFAGERRWWELKEIFCGDEITTSDETTDEDVEEGSKRHSGSHHTTEQVEGGIEVIDLTITSEDE
ncbi:UNVERIFIED_CONTAM: hypothetical protein Sindi_2340800 [Sesamum indicum]